MKPFFFGVLPFVAVLVTALCVDGGEPGKDIRPILFKPADPSFFAKLGGQNKVVPLADAAAAEELIGKQDAKGVIDRVNFAKEQLVLVSWTTSGPPEGTLKHDVKGAGDDRRLVFYVQGPAGAKVRGQRARIGADFFAVPKGVQVSFDAKER